MTTSDETTEKLRAENATLRTSLSEERRARRTAEGLLADLRRHVPGGDTDEDVVAFSKSLLPWARAIAAPFASDGDRLEALARVVHNDARPGCTDLAMFFYALADKLGRKGAWSSDAVPAANGRAA